MGVLPCVCGAAGSPGHSPASYPLHRSHLEGRPRAPWIPAKVPISEGEKGLLCLQRASSSDSVPQGKDSGHPALSPAPPGKGSGIPCPWGTRLPLTCPTPLDTTAALEKL